MLVNHSWLLNDLSMIYCEICSEKLTKNVFNLGTHPLCDDLQKIGERKPQKKYEISVDFCESCCTAHQKVQPKKEILFHEDYHYRARFTKDVLIGMKSLCEKVIELTKDNTDLKVLDVGCNDGSLLDFFSERGFSTFGIEPTKAIEDASKKHVLMQKFFDIETSNDFKSQYGKVDILTFTNVFAHISDIQNLLQSCKNVLSDEGILCIENHYLGSILAANQFDTFYHEHPRTYSAKSFFQIAKTLGMKIVSIEYPERYGGNIRVFLTKSNAYGEEVTPPSVETSKYFLNSFETMKKFITNWTHSKGREIDQLVKTHGPLPGKAFPARASILLEVLKLNETQIEAVYEKSGSKKIGHYVPGTKIPILDEIELFSKSMDRPFINFAWHIGYEIESRMRKNGYLGKMINIIER